MSKSKNPVDEYRIAWIEAALASRGLTHAEARVAARLGHHANKVTLACFPSVATLAKGAGMSDEQNVRRALRGLKWKGWITWADNPGGRRRGHGISNFYELLDTHMSPDKKNPVSAAYEACKAYEATRSPVTGLGGEQAGQNGQATLSREASNPVTSDAQPGHQRYPNLDPNLKGNPNLNLDHAGRGQAGSLATARDELALARPPKPRVRADRGRIEKEIAAVIGWEELYKLSEPDLNTLCEAWGAGVITAEILTKPP